MINIRTASYPIPAGNMQITRRKQESVRLLCHCGKNNTAEPRLDADDNLVIEDDGTIFDIEGHTIKCSSCECNWRPTSTTARKLPPLPTEWKFFACYVSIQDGDSQLAMLGLGDTLLHFVSDAMRILTSPEIVDFQCEQITEERYRKLVKESDERRASGGSSFLDFLESVFRL